MKRKKKSIFKSLGHFFDKVLIVPVTRTIVKIGKGFSNFGNSIESGLSKQNTLLFISLFAAVVIFIIVDQRLISFTNQTSEILKDQKIEAIYNEEAYVVEGLPNKVDITLMGNRSDLFIAKQSTASKVTVDLSNLKPGTHKVNIDYNQPLSSIKHSVNPSVTTVNIYPKVSVSKTLTTDILNQNSLDDKLIINNVTPEIDEVVVKGTDDKNAINSLKKVASVKALVDLSDLEDNPIGKKTIKDVSLKAYDKKGNILKVEIVPSKINVEVEVDSPSKNVPIRVIPKGEVGFGKAISSIDMSQSSVTVYGTKNALDNLQYVPLEVDVSGLKEDKDYKLDLTKPKGVKSMSVTTVNLKFKLGDSSDKDIDNVNIDVRNLNDKYSVQGISESDIKVTVNVKGVSSVLNGISAQDIIAYIDLKDYAPGEYEVPVNVEGTDSRVQYISKTKKVKIKIVEK